MSREPNRNRRPEQPVSFSRLSQRPSFNWLWWWMLPRKRLSCSLHAKNVIFLRQIWRVVQIVPADSLSSICCSMVKLRIRFCDSSTINVAQLRQTMDQFLSRISTLFVQRKAAHIHCFTQHVAGFHLFLKIKFSQNWVSSVSLWSFHTATGKIFKARLWNVNWLLNLVNGYQGYHLASEGDANQNWEPVSLCGWAWRCYAPVAVTMLWQNECLGHHHQGGPTCWISKFRSFVSLQCPSAQAQAGNCGDQERSCKGVQDFWRRTRLAPVVSQFQWCWVHGVQTKSLGF